MQSKNASHTNKAAITTEVPGLEKLGEAGKGHSGGRMLFFLFSRPANAKSKGVNYALAETQNA